MPEVDDLLLVAERKLDDARLTLRAGAGHLAARESYLSSLASARAILFAIEGINPKTHKGALTRYARLAHLKPELGLPEAVLLFEGLDTKHDVDYLASREVDAPEQLVAVAERFLAAARRLCQLPLQ